MKTISIVTVVDVVGALADGTLSRNIYMLDNNKAGGSTGEGSEALKTMVEKDDLLVWTAQPIEPEAYASITAIEIDGQYCQPKETTYEGSDVTYWAGKVKKNLKIISYTLKIKVGNRKHELSTLNAPCLIGRLTP